MTKVDQSYEAATKWRELGLALRPVLLETGLEEAFKWGKPCYVKDGSNILIVQRMNDFLAVMFFKGALIKDTHGLLVPQGENSHEAMRVELRGEEDLERFAAALPGYVAQAVELAASGAKAARPAPEETYPDELVDWLDDDAEFREAFEALTPGRRRAWALQFGGAKQSATRLRRIEAARDVILAGKGPQDR